MKKLLLLLIVSLILASCYSITQVSSKTYNYTNTIDFSINKVEERKSISDTPTSNGKWQANSKDKFVLIDMNFVNNSEKAQILNFDDFLLYNYKTDTQYKAEWFLTSGLLIKSSEIEIKPKSNRIKILVFMFPEKEEPSYLKFNNQIIEIRYKN
ncbi:MAG: hypothetical protein GQ540_06065 [Lutibacter sp.]|uniref:hypothetical protein n=1 Tax=Lutibacter sp. TaxID=1925666 RepID=UPI0019F8BB85|nr:hypothetical protein [Lutibacter sp.]NOR28076.1 hypothetical protein [Lutibacter sp.]